MYQNFIIPYVYEAQHVLGDTPPIIRSLRLHWQPLVFLTWKVVGRVVGGLCQEVYTCGWWTLSGSVHCLTTSTNHTANNLPRMKNQSLPAQF
jgi:hypothetical protein